MAAPHFPLLDQAKAVARQAALLRRAGCDPAWGEALARYVLEQAPPPPGMLVAGIWPMPGEIDFSYVLRALAERGHGLCLPVTPKRGEPLRFRRWAFGDPLAPGPFGTRHPLESAPEAIPGFILVPLLAFDRRGHRLGYGGGYYDRTLAALPDAIPLGVAFAAQQADEVPVGPHDIPLPRIATEQAVLHFGERR